MKSDIVGTKTCCKCGEPFAVRCKPCARAATEAWRLKNPGRAAAMVAAWRAANPETAKARAAKYRAKHCDEIKAKTAAWRAKNPEKAKAAVAAYLAANPEKIAAMLSAYRAANREKLSAANAAWYAANSERAKSAARALSKAHPERHRIYSENRRARKGGGKLSLGLADRLFVLQRGLCACCDKPLGSKFHLDHIVPLVRGGTNDDANIQLLTPTCNARKGAKSMQEFLAWRSSFRTGASSVQAAG